MFKQWRKRLLLILGQEAALGVLFRNRWLNELVGDWLIHFPFSSATHHVRQQILSHYRYPNDPDRASARCSGRSRCPPTRRWPGRGASARAARRCHARLDARERRRQLV